MSPLVESVVRAKTNGALIAKAAALWVGPDDLVLDPTYGQGLFWTIYQPPRLITHDKFVGDGVDFRHMPEATASVDVVVFDPPYIAQGGRRTSTVQDMLTRYGLHDVPKTTAELEVLIADGIKECTRVLKQGGRLLVKCMDYVNGGRYVQGRHHVVTTAMNCGLRQVDEFVHHSGTGPQPKRPRQITSRRAHSLLCVFQKPKSRKLL